MASGGGRGDGGDRGGAGGITHLFFDVGGVLGTGGWSTDERALAVTQFGLDAVDFDRRHREVVGMWEQGLMSLEEYLDHTVFAVPRPFSREVFVEFMLARSEPVPEMLQLAEALANTGRYRLMTINNESEALNVYRLRRFGLARMFDAFYSSCWLGVAKPARRIFELALALSQADASASVFIDDREQNLAPAAALGMHTIRFTTRPALEQALGALGVTI
jgi:putative hydrolase of the HAD superfamily